MCAQFKQKLKEDNIKRSQSCYDYKLNNNIEFWFNFDCDIWYGGQGGGRKQQFDWNNWTNRPTILALYIAIKH